MAWYAVEIPITSSNGGSGRQVFVYEDTNRRCAEARALADVHSEEAIRHRRGAAVELNKMTTSPVALDIFPLPRGPVSPVETAC
ncbi:hypothetical protein [Streptomyces sp. 7N604]|uniref:hypothetical protein n=1 Tax=Streptomyces sp. 7N604 TaxID=3457415 RepID=UPI003FD3724C